MMRYFGVLMLGFFAVGFLCLSCEDDLGEYLSAGSSDETEDTGGYVGTQGDDDSQATANDDLNTDENPSPVDTNKDLYDSNDTGTGQIEDTDTIEDRDGDGWFSDFDCDDWNPSINPGAQEIPGNGVDDNCDGMIDEQIDTDWDDQCATQSYEAKLDRKPSDIIFILDNSGSMGLEAKWVQENMNDFSQQIAASGVDYRVVVISSYPDNENGICIAPPLGSGGCPYKDTKLPRFMHVNQKVESTNGLSLFLSTYILWQHVLRADSVKHIVMVTDDNSSMSAFAFQLAVKALGSKMSGYKFHGIFCYTNCNSAAAVGSVYKTLVSRTNGVSGDLCLQNFTPVFNKLATEVVKESKISCKIPMPKAPAGKKIDLDEVKIELVPTPGSAAQEIPHVTNSGKCGGGGWYYDNNTNPTKIILCPSTCNWAQGLTDAELTVDSGCLEPVV